MAGREDGSEQVAMAGIENEEMWLEADWMRSLTNSCMSREVEVDSK